MSETVPVWAFMGLLGLFQAVIVLMLTRLWTAIDANTKAVNDLSVNIPTNYATKSEVLRHHEEDLRGFADARAEIRSVRGSIQGLAMRVTAIDGSVKDAQADLGGRGA